MAPDLSRVGSILVIKLRAIGDVLLSTAAIPGLRAAFPAAGIDFLTERASREVVEGNPHLREVLVFHPGTTSGAGLIADVRRRRYDLVIDLFGNPRSAIVTLLSGAKIRVGYRFSWRRRCYNLVVEPRGGEVHNTDFNLDALRAMGLAPGKPVPFFPVGSEEERFGSDFFEREGLTGKPVVALNPGGGWPSKRWRVDRFARLGDVAAERYGARVLVAWGPGEREAAASLASGMKSPAVLIPPANLKQLAAILRRCTVLVTNDSGPMHIAAAVGTPVVAVFGPTRPELQGPVGEGHRVVRHTGLACLGCNYTRCPIGNPCMEDLEVSEVAEALRGLAEGGTARTG